MAGRPAAVQLAFLLALMLLGALLSSLLSTLLLLATGEPGDTAMGNAPLLRAFQLIASLCCFLLPALTLAACRGDMGSDLHTRRLPAAQAFLLTFICMLLLAPSINLLGALNQRMELPEALAPVEAWMRSQEDQAERLTTLLLSEPGIGALLANLLVVAVVAAITEEFLFRGALQRVIGGWTSNPHIVIWTAAILFSAFHLQFYGFLPRALLGAYFGYLLLWGRSIWLPVFAHFTNNALAVIGMSDSRLRDSALVTGDIPEEHFPEFCLAAFLTFLLFVLLNRRLRWSLRRHG